MKNQNNEFFLKDRLTGTQIRKFMLFDNEELIFATREHWLPLVVRLIRSGAASLVIASVVAGVLIAFLGSVSLSIGFFFLILLIGGIAAIRDLIHWSFHIYIATSKQIIEVHYSPLLSEAINSVLLDQIRCTEIDVEMYGLIPELLGIGNVELTFDRPTHKEEFIIRDIRSPRKIASLLSGQIHQNPQVVSQQSQLLWTRGDENNKYKFIGDSNYGYFAN